MSLKKTLLFQIILLLLFVIHGSLDANTIKGRISVSDYYSIDNESQDLHILSTKVRVYKLEEDEPGWYFNFNGKIKKKALNGNFSEESLEYVLREAWLGYKFSNKKVRATIGRQYIEEMYSSYVDGLSLKYSFTDELTAGIFGGLAPDKYDSSFNSKFKTIGIYAELDRARYNVKAGYENLKYKGETDREYLSVKLYAGLRDDLKLNSTTVASKDQITDEIKFENVNLNLIYSYSKELRFTAFYNYYRAVKLYASAKDYFNIDIYDDYFYEFNSLERVGLKVNYRVFKNLKLLGSVVYQKRGSDDGKAVRYTAGIRRRDLYGFDLSGRYTHVDNYDSIEDEFRVEASRRLMDKFDVSVYVTQEFEALDQEGSFSNDSLTYGSSLYWRINKSYDFFIFVERYEEDDYYNTSIFSKVGFRF
jgi:hypothetical protein